MNYRVEHMQGVAGVDEKSVETETVMADSPIAAIRMVAGDLDGWVERDGALENPDVSNDSGRYCDYWMALPARCIIEARHRHHGGGNWDSDYVGTESYTEDEARDYMAELASSHEWEGWEFRIVQDDGDGCYCNEIASVSGQDEFDFADVLTDDCGAMEYWRSLDDSMKRYYYELLSTKSKSDVIAEIQQDALGDGFGGAVDE